MRENAARRRTIVFLVFFSFCVSFAGAQTLFSYDDESVSKQEFLQAFRKNNASVTPSAKAYRDYLDLYIRYKLKVKAAYDLRLDTLPAQAAELQNFRNQIVEPYLHNETSVVKLVREAFVRSQKDIDLSHIFIGIPAGAPPADTLRVFEKAKQAYSDLMQGKDFGETAARYSEDPFAKNNLGHIGWITAFSLPYELETLAYTTAPGKISRLYRSRTGYHIFRNNRVRKDPGKVRVAQILLIYPPNARVDIRDAARQRADSLYDVISRGGDFGALARRFSGDNLSYQIGGEIPEFSVGRYDTEFENQAFGLKKDSEVSKPFLTSYGYHIIRRLGRRPVSEVLDKTTHDAIRRQVMNDSRIEIARRDMLSDILKTTGFRKNPKVRDQDLWDFTDSIVLRNKFPDKSDLNSLTTLFSFGPKNFTVGNWLDYRKAIRNVPGAPQRSNEELFERFKENVAYDYYRNHLELYNKKFAAELKEFKDGNLLFEIMQRKVWDRAASDSAALAEFYQEHQSKYQWEPSADALMLTFTTERDARNFSRLIQQKPASWRRIVDSSGNQVQADSGRFELSHLPLSERGGYHEGQFSSLVNNPADNSVTAAYIIKMYPKRLPRNFQDAKGLVINDFQNALEDKWISELKRKYPVKINEAVLNSLPK
jgi:peptidyl-prolyl cis-trans isomerase SurA